MDRRYPVGKFAYQPSITPASRAADIETIGRLPRELRAAVEQAGEARLDTPYRDGGWTVRQVVHHVADSHINAYVRFKLIVTETSPVLKPYEEARWAELEDGRRGDPAVSLGILDGLHVRWHYLLTRLPAEAFARTGHHPERGDITLDWLLQLYAWHGRHHTGHVNLVAAD
ncbi:MAG: putative metal-dependent hydrolase [Acidobacteria bacterium]|nr:putative metal-dependent hydrolase [Acidobacteriota bacterium]